MTQDNTQPTLRDLIAMSALGGTLGRVERVTGREHEIAAHCYALADAMLAVRAKADAKFSSKLNQYAQGVMK